MPTCPNGHNSADDEYCDVCGLAMAPSSVPASSADRPDVAEVAPATSTCPACGAALDGRFCESCGHDSLTAPPASVGSAPDVDPAPKPKSWTATVTADRAYFNQVMAIGGPDAGGIEFPAFCPDRYFPLRGKQITIGRHSASRGINPDIDLTGPPADPGVSHMHAMLLLDADGGLSVVDLGSSNGTTVNDTQVALRANTPRPLASGDKVHVGAWTTITVRLSG
jgi:hypothetical protein